MIKPEPWREWCGFCGRNRLQKSLRQAYPLMNVKIQQEMLVPNALFGLA
ncbi:hypothetical protein RMSM_01764 [Rhodopirellula maiorica SM1]|uniref:Uncharacterized protein n=1 Tax=Rhodopirellula maiorica SM1 TaxID=1265738 RepID=M5S538_9BACT|nr:hypothetical protein RMSM_01764 [Rhodopirellula maiorica SM1]